MRLGTTLVIVFALFTAAAGGQGAAPQERAEAIKQSIAQNQAALRQYTWTETTEISLKGEVKKKSRSSASTARTARFRRLRFRALRRHQRRPRRKVAQVEAVAVRKKRSLKTRSRT